MEKSAIKSLIFAMPPGICHLGYPVVTITVYPSLRCHYFEYQIGKIIHISPIGVDRMTPLLPVATLTLTVPLKVKIISPFRGRGCERVPKPSRR